jgi:hypothetical protein
MAINISQKDFVFRTYAQNTEGFLGVACHRHNFVTLGQALFHAENSALAHIEKVEGLPVVWVSFKTLEIPRPVAAFRMAWSVKDRGFEQAGMKYVRTGPDGKYVRRNGKLQLDPMLARHFLFRVGRTKNSPEGGDFVLYPDGTEIREIVAVPQWLAIFALMDMEAKLDASMRKKARIVNLSGKIPTLKKSEIDEAIQEGYDRAKSRYEYNVERRQEMKREREQRRIANGVL